MTDPSARDREVAENLSDLENENAAAMRICDLIPGARWGDPFVRAQCWTIARWHLNALAAARAEGAKAERGVCEGELRSISALIDYWHFARPDDATRRHHDCSCHMCADLVRWLKASGMVRTPTPDDLPAWSFARRVNKRAHGGEADHA